MVLSGEDGTCACGAERPESVPDRMAVSMDEGLASDGAKTSTPKPSVLQPPTHRPRCKRPRRTTRLPPRSRFPPWELVFASTVRNPMTQHLPHDFSRCIGGCSIVVTCLYEPNRCTDVMLRVTTTLGPPRVDIKHENAFGCGISWAEEKGCVAFANPQLPNGTAPVNRNRIWLFANSGGTHGVQTVGLSNHNLLRGGQEPRKSGWKPAWAVSCKQASGRGTVKTIPCGKTTDHQICG